MSLGRRLHGLGRSALAIAACAVLSATSAPTGSSIAATPPAPPPAPAAPTPERTASAFGDWMVNCIQPASGPRQCEAALSVQDQQHQIGLAFFIGRPSRDQPQRIVMQVPANIRTAEPLRLTIDSGDPVVIPFEFCNRLGCFANMDLRDNAVVTRLRKHAPETPGRAEWRDSANNVVQAPISLRGFGAAMDFLAVDASK